MNDSPARASSGLLGYRRAAPRLIAIGNTHEAVGRRRRVGRSPLARFQPVSKHH